MNTEFSRILVKEHLYRESTFLPVRIAKSPIITESKVGDFPQPVGKKWQKGS